MNTLVVLSEEVIGVGIAFNADSADTSDVRFAFATNFDKVKDLTYSSIIYIGGVPSATRKQFQSLIN
jgi:hypothetical protein